MDALFAEVEFWHWLVVGLGLVILEMLAPGVVFLWLGIAAGLVGLLLFALPDLTWQTQLLTFAVLSVASIAAGRLWLRRRPIATDRPALNRRGDALVGRSFVLATAIAGGEGRLRIDDTVWKIIGPDLPAGARVRIEAADGAILRVAAE